MFGVSVGMSIPPYVEGPLRGEAEMSVDKFQWLVDSNTFESRGPLTIQVQWWGSTDSSIFGTIVSDRQGNNVETQSQFSSLKWFPIKCSPEKLQRYFRDLRKLELKVFLGEMHIGTGTIKVDTSFEIHSRGICTLDGAVTVFTESNIPHPIGLVNVELSIRLGDHSKLLQSMNEEESSETSSVTDIAENPLLTSFELNELKANTDLDNKLPHTPPVASSAFHVDKEFARDLPKPPVRQTEQFKKDIEANQRALEVIKRIRHKNPVAPTAPSFSNIKSRDLMSPEPKIQTRPVKKEVIPSLMSNILERGASLQERMNEAINEPSFFYAGVVEDSALDQTGDENDLLSSYVPNVLNKIGLEMQRRTPTVVFEDLMQPLTASVARGLQLVDSLNIYLRNIEIKTLASNPTFDIWKVDISTILPSPISAVSSPGFIRSTLIESEMQAARGRISTKNQKSHANVKFVLNQRTSLPLEFNYQLVEKWLQGKLSFTVRKVTTANKSTSTGMSMAIGEFSLRQLMMSETFECSISLPLFRPNDVDEPIGHALLEISLGSQDGAQQRSLLMKQAELEAQVISVPPMIITPPKKEQSKEFQAEFTRFEPLEGFSCNSMYLKFRLKGMDPITLIAGMKKRFTCALIDIPCPFFFEVYNKQDILVGLAKVSMTYFNTWLIVHDTFTGLDRAKILVSLDLLDSNDVLEPDEPLAPNQHVRTEETSIDVLEQLQMLNTTSVDLIQALDHPRYVQSGNIHTTDLFDSNDDLKSNESPAPVQHVQFVEKSIGIDKPVHQLLAKEFNSSPIEVAEPVKDASHVQSGEAHSEIEPQEKLEEENLPPVKPADAEENGTSNMEVRNESKDIVNKVEPVTEQGSYRTNMDTPPLPSPVLNIPATFQSSPGSVPSLKVCIPDRDTTETDEEQHVFVFEVQGSCHRRDLSGISISYHFPFRSNSFNSVTHEIWWDSNVVPHNTAGRHMIELSHHDSLDDFLPGDTQHMTFELQSGGVAELAGHLLRDLVSKAVSISSPATSASPFQLESRFSRSFKLPIKLPSNSQGHYLNLNVKYLKYSTSTTKSKSPVVLRSPTVSRKRVPLKKVDVARAIICVRIMQIKGVKSLARNIALASNPGMFLPAAVGVNPSISVEFRNSRFDSDTLARTFEPCFEYEEIQFPIVLETESLGDLSNGVCLIKLWHHSHVDDPRILLGVSKVPLKQLLLSESGVDGEFPIVLPAGVQSQDDTVGSTIRVQIFFDHHRVIAKGNAQVAIGLMSEDGSNNMSRGIEVASVVALDESAAESSVFELENANVEVDNSAETSILEVDNQGVDGDQTAKLLPVIDTVNIGEVEIRLEDTESTSKKLLEANPHIVDASPDPEVIGNASSGFEICVEKAMHLPLVLSNDQLVIPNAYVVYSCDSERFSVRRFTKPSEQSSCSPSWNDWQHTDLHSESVHFQVWHNSSWSEVSSEQQVLEDRSPPGINYAPYGEHSASAKMPGHRDYVYNRRDIFLGTAVVDLASLKAGIEEINGWYHIVDADQRRVGQLKVVIRTLGETKRLTSSNETIWERSTDASQLKDVFQTLNQIDSDLHRRFPDPIADKPESFESRSNLAELADQNAPSSQGVSSVLLPNDTESTFINLEGASVRTPVEESAWDHFDSLNGPDDNDSPTSFDMLANRGDWDEPGFQEDGDCLSDGSASDVASSPVPTHPLSSDELEPMDAFETSQKLEESSLEAVDFPLDDFGVERSHNFSVSAEKALMSRADVENESVEPETVESKEIEGHNISVGCDPVVAEPLSTDAATNTNECVNGNIDDTSLQCQEALDSSSVKTDVDMIDTECLNVNTDNISLECQEAISVKTEVDMIDTECLSVDTDNTSLEYQEAISVKTEVDMIDTECLNVDTDNTSLECQEAISVKTEVDMIDTECLNVDTDNISLECQEAIGVKTDVDMTECLNVDTDNTSLECQEAISVKTEVDMIDTECLNVDTDNISLECQEAIGVKTDVDMIDTECPVLIDDITDTPFESQTELDYSNVKPDFDISLDLVDISLPLAVSPLVTNKPHVSSTFYNQLSQHATMVLPSSHVVGLNIHLSERNRMSWMDPETARIMRILRGRR